MIFNLFRPKAHDPVDLIYLDVVAKARQPGFYLDFSVPDTVEGRFEMIIVHLALLFHRLRNEDERARKAAQTVVEAFFNDMDRSLREMGIGDTSVPKKMKKLGKAYNGRSLAYFKALDEDDRDAFSAAVLRNVMALDAGTETDAQISGARAIADYAFATAILMQSLPVSDILSGKLQTAPLVSTTGADRSSEPDLATAGDES